MEAKELRIGNFFNEKYSSETIKVVGLSEDRIDFSGCYLSKWQCEPIPLTEEWLLKFGFENKESKIYFLMVNKWGFAIGSDGSYGLYNNQDAWNRGESFSNRETIDYVHQLQNLYFALTGEELEIKK